MDHRLVRLIARTATKGWCRSVEVTGLERIPRSGPVLLVANHPRGIRRPRAVDRHRPPIVRFLAMALLANAIPSGFVYVVGRRPMAPVTHATVNSWSRSPRRRELGRAHLVEAVRRFAPAASHGR
jgi:hypothetical protein